VLTKHKQYVKLMTYGTENKHHKKRINRNGYGDGAGL
jgi:hypothetical protein